MRYPKLGDNLSKNSFIHSSHTYKLFADVAFSYKHQSWPCCCCESPHTWRLRLQEPRRRRRAKVHSTFFLHLQSDNNNKKAINKIVRMFKRSQKLIHSFIHSSGVCCFGVCVFWHVCVSVSADMCVCVCVCVFGVCVFGVCV